MNGKGFAQRLRHVIAKHESSLASAGDEILFGRSFRRDGACRRLYMVLCYLRIVCVERPLTGPLTGVLKYVKGRYRQSCYHK